MDTIDGLLHVLRMVALLLSFVCFILVMRAYSKNDTRNMIMNTASMLFNMFTVLELSRLS